MKEKFIDSKQKEIDFREDSKGRTIITLIEELLKRYNLKRQDCKIYDDVISSAVLKNGEFYYRDRPIATNVYWQKVFPKAENIAKQNTEIKLEEKPLQKEEEKQKELSPQIEIKNEPEPEKELTLKQQRNLNFMHGQWD